MNDYSKHTPGPWYADKRGSIWRRPPADLYENGGGVGGDKLIATAHKGWHLAGSSDPAHAITISVDVSTLSVETAIRLSSELFSAAAHRIHESSRLAALGVVA